MIDSVTGSAATADAAFIRSGDRSKIFANASNGRANSKIAKRDRYPNPISYKCRYSNPKTAKPIP